MEISFAEALENHKPLEEYPKSDLHVHAGRGGSQEFIMERTGKRIKSRCTPFASLGDMQLWFEEEIKSCCCGTEGYLLRLEGAFARAAEEHIKVLCMEFSYSELMQLGSLQDFIRLTETFRKKYCPDTIFCPELAIGWECPAEEALRQLEELLPYHWICSLDLCNRELAQPVKNFVPLYRTAKANGLCLRAHTGEFGTAEDVWEAVELLELDEVQHGIAAAASPQTMYFLRDNHICLNLCPTSNIMLGRTGDYKTHPIRLFYDYGVPVTINTDDMLIFNSSVSGEYRMLYDSGCMKPEELDTIRQFGLRKGLGKKSLI